MVKVLFTSLFMCLAALAFAQNPTGDQQVLVCDNEPIRVRALLSNAEFSQLILQWQTSVDNGQTWADIPGEHDLIVEIPIPTENLRIRFITVPKTDPLRDKSQWNPSFIMLIKVIVPPMWDASTHVLSGCVGQSIPLSKGNNVSIGAVRLQWQKKENTESDTWNDLPADTTATFNAPTDVAGEAHYRVTETDKCGNVTVVDIFDVTVQAPPMLSWQTADTLFCVVDGPKTLTGGSPAIFSNNKPGIYTGDGVENGVFYPDRAGVGQHVISYTSPEGLCEATETITVRVLESPKLQDMADVFLLKRQQARLQPETNGTSFSWTPAQGLDNPHARDPMASPTETTVYTLTVTNDAGCIVRKTVRVVVLLNLDIPNGFSPNGDGINDTWEIEGLSDYPQYSIRIFNRWGAEIYRADNTYKPWDGRYQGSQLPTATYYYVVTSPKLPKPLTGSVAIIR